MPITLTCDCGARFDLDEGMAGRKVDCPECLQPLEVPAAPAAGPPRTSVCALAALVLALVGAFTLIGSAAAVLLGVIALVQIQAHRDRLTGTVFASIAILAGAGFTALTVMLLVRPHLVPVDGWLRQRTLAGQVDATGALEVLSSDGNVVVRRPSEAWGRLRGDRGDDPAVGELQQKRDLLLTNLKRHAFIDVSRAGRQADWDLLSRQLEADLQPPREIVMGDEENEFTGAPLQAPRLVKGRQDIEKSPVAGYEAREWIYDVNRGGQTWRFLIRAYRTAMVDHAGIRTDPIYIIRGYAPKNRFAACESELRAAMDTIQLPK
jgi:hypothetical protein